jgi:isopentenyldiphosphate isomerase
MDNELLDLVDKDDKVIGTINRNDYARLMSEELGYIRAAELFIVNSKGQVYAPIRTANKTIAPNGYDYSADGHVEAGDDYLSTIIREAKEELTIEIHREELELVSKRILDKIRYIQCIYLLHSDDTPKFNPDDFVNAEWLYPEEILHKINEGHPAKSNLREAIRLLQEYLAKH